MNLVKMEMLSAVAFRACKLRCSLIPKFSGCNIIALRSASTELAQKVSEPVEPQIPLRKLPVIPKDGPERDLVNFPRPVRALNSGKVRMGFIPEEWFQFFYKKTGVTGPYLFGGGLTTYLLSKEILVVEHEFWVGVTITIMAVFAIKKFGPQTRAYGEKCVQEEEKYYDDFKQDSVRNLEENIEFEKKSQWHATGQKLLFDAKRENINMQLEAEYRNRLMTVYQEVKNRLDYQLGIQNAVRRFQQSHMVNWIVANVMKSITPQQEKEALQKCITDLKALSSKA